MGGAGNNLERFGPGIRAFFQMTVAYDLKNVPYDTSPVQSAGT